MSAPTPRPPRWWRRPVPVNLGTVGFCVLEGLTLGLPTSHFLPDGLREGIVVPSALRDTAGSVCFYACLALPVWSLLAPSKRLFRGVGLGTCVGTILFLFLREIWRAVAHP